MPTFYCLDLETAGVAAVARVNGVPLAIDPTGEGLRTVRPINEWLLPDANALTVLLSAPIDPAFVREAPFLRSTVFRADPASAFPKPAETLASFAWPAADVPQTFPYRAERPFRIAEPPASRLWGEAARLEEPADADRARILAIVEEFGRALAEGRGEDAFRIAAYRFEDDARVNGIDPSELRKSILSQYRWIASQPNLRARAVTAAEAEFTLVAGGRLVLAGRRPGNPEALVVEGDELAARFELYFARIGGDWRIAR